MLLAQRCAGQLRPVSRALATCSTFVCPALLQPQCSLLASAGFRFKPSPHASVSCKHVRYFVLYKTEATPSSRILPALSKFDAKMATPETFSETGSETMYEKVSSSVT